MMAAMSQTPELQISPNEAKLIADSVQKVGRHYSNSVMSEKSMDWLNLFSALGAVYIPRAFAIKMRQASDRAKPVEPPQPEPPQPFGSPLEGGMP